MKRSKVFKYLFVLLIIGFLIWLGYTGFKERWFNINGWFVGGNPFGVDVSSYQERTDFNKLKDQGVEFAYIKATEGSTHVDPSFSQKWKDAADAGMLVGAYHFFSYESSGTKQAKNYIETVGKLKGKLIPAVDMELSMTEVYNPPEKEDVVRGLKAFIAVVEEEYGVKPLIYAQKDYFDKYLADDFKDYPKWVRNVFYPVWIDMGDDWTVWQYNDHGQLKGYQGETYIDYNVVNMTKGGLDAIKVK